MISLIVFKKIANIIKNKKVKYSCEKTFLLSSNTKNLFTSVREWHPKYEWVLGLGLGAVPKPKTH